MDKWDALPTQQKALVFAILLALVAGGFYYLVVSDVQTAADGALRQQKQLQAEYTQLKDFEKQQMQVQAQEQKAAEEAKLAENRKMLPTEDEIPSFIMGIKADADAAGLEIVRFDPQPAELEDYYKRIPVKVEVTGRYLDLIDFLQTLAGPKKRIVNVRQFHIERLPIDIAAMKAALGESGSEFDQASDWARDQKEREGMTNEELRMLKIRKWQQANEVNQVRATFVAYTFSYTGQPLTDDQKKGGGRRG